MAWFNFKKQPKAEAAPAAAPTVANADVEMSVNAEACDGCGKCVDECGRAAISLASGTAALDMDKCSKCLLCTKVCPKDAISPAATAKEKEDYAALKAARAARMAAFKATLVEAAEASE